MNMNMTQLRGSYEADTNRNGDKMSRRTILLHCIEGVPFHSITSGHTRRQAVTQAIERW